MSQMWYHARESRPRKGMGAMLGVPRAFIRKEFHSNMKEPTEKERAWYEKGLEDGLAINKRNYKPTRVLTENGSRYEL